MFKGFYRIIFCILCLSFLLSCSEQANNINLLQDNRNRKEIIAELNNSVFCLYIIIQGKDAESSLTEHKYSVGTGFLIGPGLMASAFHIQSKAEELTKKLGGSSLRLVGFRKLRTGETLQFPIEFAFSDQENDLAIYRFDNSILSDNPKFSSSKPLVLAKNLPPLGEEVLSIGYYGTYEFPFNSIGNVAMIDGNEDIVSDLTLMPGNSGAPLCDLETGEVLGVTVSILDLGNETVRYGFAKRAAKLNALLMEKLKTKN